MTEVADVLFWLGLVIVALVKVIVVLAINAQAISSVRREIGDYTAPIIAAALVVDGAILMAAGWWLA